MTMVARHDDGVVAVADALHEAAAQPADGEHGLHHHRAGERVGRHRPYAGDDGRRGVFERVPEQHRPLRRTPRARRARTGGSAERAAAWRPASAAPHTPPGRAPARRPAGTCRRPCADQTPNQPSFRQNTSKSSVATTKPGVGRQQRGEEEHRRGRPPARAEPPPDSPAPRPAAGRQAARARPAAPKRRKRRTPFPKRRARSSARCRNPRAGRCPDRAGTARARSCPDESG